MVGGEEATQNPDSGFEQVYVLVDVEIEIIFDPILSLYKLLLQIHHNHGVQAVDQGEAKVEPGQ